MLIIITSHCNSDRAPTMLSFIFSANAIIIYCSRVDASRAFNIDILVRRALVLTDAWAKRRALHADIISREIVLYWLCAMRLYKFLLIPRTLRCRTIHIARFQPRQFLLTNADYIKHAIPLSARRRELSTGHRLPLIPTAIIYHWHR